MGYFDSQQFDASKVDPAMGFDPIPENVYPVMVLKAEEKATKNGGMQLVLQMQVLSGQYAKRQIYSRINLVNASAKCVELGRAELSAFCRATGVMVPKAVHEFANKTLQVHVKVVTRQDNNKLTNEVAKYEPMSGAQQPQQLPQAVGAGVGATSAPWAK